MKRVLIIIAACLPLSLLAKVDTEIRGRVVDGLTHQALSESHVFIDEQNGVLTDSQGYYRIYVPEELMDGSLNASYMGYGTFTVPLNKIENQVLDIELVENMILMNEIVIYTDKWNLLEETILELADSYPDKEAFYDELLARMKTLDRKLPEVKQAGVARGNWPIIIISALILLMWTILCRPLFKDMFINKKSSK